MSSDAFELLGLKARGVTVAEVKKAYAAKLKQVRPDEDREGFMALRRAFEFARDQASYQEVARSARTEAKRRKVAHETGDKVESLAAKQPARSAELPADADGSEPSANEAAHSPAPHVPAIAPAEVAMADIEALIAEPWRWQDPAAWQEILNRDDLQSLDDFQDLAYRLKDFVLTQSGYGHKEQPEPQNWMTNDVLELLDGRFGWTRSGARNQWEQMEAHWLARLFDQFSWYHSRVADSPGFSNAWAPASGESYGRPHWLLHPVVPIGVIYSVVWMHRLFESVPYSRSMAGFAPLLQVLLMIGGVFFVVVFMRVVAEFLAEFALLIRRGLLRTFRRPIRHLATSGWYTTNDWLMIVFLVGAIVLFESQYTPPILPARPVLGVVPN